MWSRNITQCFVSYLVEIAGSPNRSDFICVVEEADTCLSQAVTLSDLDFTEAFDKLLPHV